MQTLILAGGQGTRLRPYTTVLPKPLMPVGDYPILEIIFRQLRAAGVTEIILAVGHMRELFEAFFREGKRFGMTVSYTYEEEPLGTAGPIALAIDRLDRDFLVMNGDLLTTLDYRRFFEFHQSKEAVASIAVHRREVKMDYGVIEARDGKLAKYTEKPTYPVLVSMGINCLNREAIRPFLKPGTYQDIPQLMTALQESGRAVLCYDEPCYWLDIGRVEDYQIATTVFKERRAEFFREET